MSKRIALITGANKGIGYQTALQLGKKGIYILVASRDIEAGESAVMQLKQEGVSAEPLQLDITSKENIATAASYVESTFGKLDILVNNAGVMLDAFDKSPTQQSSEVWRKTFDVNLFGAVDVTNAFVALLKNSDAGRIVNVSSILGSMAANTDPESEFYNFKIPAYNISKSAINAWTVHLAYELRDTPIKVNAAHPGFVKTDLHGVDAPLTPEEGAYTSVALAMLADDGPNGEFYHVSERQPW
ncbi:short-chain dehydrogenase [Erwinia typographi]|uniref:Short-chain dehydrogenase n=1 Tax=Erwinia typographi TaxID=371042 RepID=A0A0A3YID1_9GAMM|nr:SDR family oxidoreductase [Erwinia typographi]KGT86492.1 short-chain dehydrogenase [Erwinia typographi]